MVNQTQNTTDHPIDADRPVCRSDFYIVGGVVARWHLPATQH